MDEFKPNIIILHYPNPFVTHYLMKYKSRDFKLLVQVLAQLFLGAVFVDGQPDRVLVAVIEFRQGFPEVVVGTDDVASTLYIVAVVAQAGHGVEERLVGDTTMGIEAVGDIVE